MAVSEGEPVDTPDGVDFHSLDPLVVDGHEYADYQPAVLYVGAWIDSAARTVSRIDAPRRNWGA